MPINFEEIRLKTICPECSNTNMKLGYSTTEAGIYSPSSFMGMKAYSYATDRVLVICDQCGLIVKEYAKDPAKLK
jgi:hypothetical protein